MLSLLLLSGGVFAQNANGIDASAGGVAGNDWASANADVEEDKRTIKVTVNDADINVPLTQMDNGPDRYNLAYDDQNFNGGLKVLTLKLKPIADRDGDGYVNDNDVFVVPEDSTDTAAIIDENGDKIPDLAVDSVDAGNGKVTIRALKGQTFSGNFRLIYDAAEYNTTTDADGREAVVVSSSRTRAGIGLRLTERTAAGDPNRTIGQYSADIIVRDSEPDGYLDGGKYSTFDENGLLDADGAPVDLDGNGDMDNDSVDVAFYPEAYEVGTTFTLAANADNEAQYFDDRKTAVFPDTADDEDATSATAVALIGGTWNESAFENAIDLDGDGTTTGTGIKVAFYEEHYNADLDGGGNDATGEGAEGMDDAVTEYNAALFPEGKAPTLLVSGNDTVTATYSDLNAKAKRSGTTSRDTVRIESEAPGFSNLVPDSGTNTTSRVPRLSADITDGESGVERESIRFEVMLWDDHNNDNKVQDDDENNEVGAEVGVFTESGAGNQVNWVTITGGYRVGVTLPQQDIEVGLAWRVVAEDTAGNVLETDIDLTDDKVSYASLKIDNVAPKLNAAFTGHVWDTTKDPDGPDENAGDRTSVRVQFTEGLDPASVEANDFRIGNAAPSDANAFGDSVYLTVTTLAPDDTPVVELTGEVTDRSGNVLQPGATRTSEDGINPKVTVALGGTLTNGDVDVTITTDEDIAGAPSLMTTFTDIEVTPATDATDDASATEAVTTETEKTTTVFGLTSPSARTWVTTVSKNETASGGKSGRINVEVAAADSIGNKGSAGKDGDGSVRGSITYELDLFINGGANGAKSVPPTFVVSGANDKDVPETAQASPFVRILFSEEAKEYDGDTNKMVTLTSLTVAETPAGGTQGTAGDVMGSVIRRADNEFVLPLQEMTLGNTYEIAVNAVDSAGNTYTAAMKSSFKVVARPQVNIVLEPGMNLVSFPEIPVEPGINEVFGAESGVDVVLSYDPALDVPWLISQRNAEGVFGEDAEIQSVQVGRAYWVQTQGFSDIKYASRPYLDSTQVPPQPPPAIHVLGGESNLIGFISLEAGVTEVDATAYFSGVKWQVAYSYNSSEGWSVLRPDVGQCTEEVKTSCVMEKRGYIVFATSDGVVTP